MAAGHNVTQWLNDILQARPFMEWYSYFLYFSKKWQCLSKYSVEMNIMENIFIINA
jgi:hypothetical protein